MFTAYTPAIAADKNIFEANCTVLEQAGDAVYVFSVDEVRQAIANDPLKSDAIGIIERKLTNTKCIVRKMGFIDDIYTSLVIGVYYLSQTIPGEIQDVVPISGIIKVVGHSISDTSFYVDTGRIPVIR